MQRPAVGFLLLIATIASATPALAQICAGYPTVDYGFSAGASLDFGELDGWGVEGSYDPPGAIGIFGGVDVRSPDGSDDSDYAVFAGVAAPLLSVGVGGADSLSICPVGRIGYTDYESGSLLSVPIGIGFGTSVAKSGIPVMPYMIPQLVISRFSGGTAGSDTSTDLGFRGGVLVDFRFVYVGGEVEHVFREDGDPTFGLRAGVRY